MILEFDGDVVTLPDPAGGASNAAGDFDRLLLFASALPLRSRIDEQATWSSALRSLIPFAMRLPACWTWRETVQNGAA